MFQTSSRHSMQRKEPCGSSPVLGTPLVMQIHRMVISIFLPFFFFFLIFLSNIFFPSLFFFFFLNKLRAFFTGISQVRTSNTARGRAGGGSRGHMTSSGTPLSKGCCRRPTSHSNPTSIIGLRPIYLS